MENDDNVVLVLVFMATLLIIGFGAGYFYNDNDILAKNVVYSKQFAVKQGFAHYATESGLFILDLKEAK